MTISIQQIGIQVKSKILQRKSCHPLSITTLPHLKWSLEPLSLRSWMWLCQYFWEVSSEAKKACMEILFVQMPMSIQNASVLPLFFCLVLTLSKPGPIPNYIYHRQLNHYWSTKTPHSQKNFSLWGIFVHVHTEVKTSQDLSPTISFKYSFSAFAVVLDKGYSHTKISYVRNFS